MAMIQPAPLCPCNLWNLLKRKKQPIAVNHTTAGNPAKYVYTYHPSSDRLSVGGKGGRGGTYQFTIGCNVFVAVCQRYMRATNQQRHMTSYFNDPKWPVNQWPKGIKNGRRNLPTIPPLIQYLHKAMVAKLQKLTCACCGSGQKLTCACCGIGSNCPTTGSKKGPSSQGPTSNCGTTGALGSGSRRRGGRKAGGAKAQSAAITRSSPR